MADSLLKTFSLSNILRQMFCGVVFFASFRKFSSGHLFPINESTNQCITLLILSIIVGTIIYHIEKNFVSYAQQVGLEIVIKFDKKGYWDIVLFILTIFAFSAHLVCAFCIVTNCLSKWIETPLLHETACKILLIAILALLFFSAFLIVFALSFARNIWSNLMNRTRLMWELEELNIAPLREILKKQDNDRWETGLDKKFFFELFRLHVTAKRLATWSDFIHCSQSCVIAWLFGAFASLLRSATLPALDNKFLIYSLAICLLILVAEFIIESHRYMHVLKITEKYRTILSYGESCNITILVNRVTSECDNKPKAQ